VETTYAVTWREPDGPTYVGRLTLGADALRLDGRASDGPTVGRRLGYEELRRVRMEHRGSDRLDGRPTLVIDRADGSYRVTSAVIGAGILQELVDRVSELRSSYGGANL
jgi:hypothetical protein